MGLSVSAVVSAAIMTVLLLLFLGLIRDLLGLLGGGRLRLGFCLLNPRAFYGSTPMAQLGAFIGLLPARYLLVHLSDYRRE